MFPHLHPFACQLNKKKQILGSRICLTNNLWGLISTTGLSRFGSLTDAVFVRLKQRTDPDFYLVHKADRSFNYFMSLNFIKIEKEFHLTLFHLDSSTDIVFTMGGRINRKVFFVRKCRWRSSLALLHTHFNYTSNFTL